MPLNIVALVKHVVDESQLKVEQSTGAVNFQGVPGKISTFDRNALEAALRLKQKAGGTVTVLTVGPEEANKSIREAMAMGADAAMLVKTEKLMELDAHQVVQTLVKALEKIKDWNLVICAEGSADTYTSLVPAMLAEKFGIPLLSYLKSVDFDGTRLEGERALERNIVTVNCSIPAVVSVVSEINEPRIPTLLQIMAAMRKQVTIVPLQELGDIPATMYKVTSVSGKTSERKKVIFEGSSSEVASKMVKALTEEGLV